MFDGKRDKTKWLGHWEKITKGAEVKVSLLVYDWKPSKSVSETLLSIDYISMIATLQ